MDIHHAGVPRSLLPSTVVAMDVPSFQQAHFHPINSHNHKFAAVLAAFASPSHRRGPSSAPSGVGDICVGDKCHYLSCSDPIIDYRRRRTHVLG
ncbi:hypothetical protein BU23DRAFT_304908 [Bimuria novae-zelandiae CBS 107.79]|uniref:Uncharacterized protein n=1 Tax=Bimuria novae-zelandiae CBS 107.79 TaxID=1447943 RepID=A0A6A5UQW0_9PLEO|nr:hypothetical protein BU23DRAFT_304908 [Bimuria novae-zelandiae CBS 107.79]